MPKVLLHTDSPCLYSGLARCGKELAKRFNEKFEFAYAGWHHQPKPYAYPYFIYPITKETQYETKELQNILDDFQPEIIFSIGDIWNYSKTQAAIRAYKENKRNAKWMLWLTIDGENLHPSWSEILELADDVSVFSRFGKQVIKSEFGIETTSVYPGVDSNTFKRVKVELKQKGAFPFSVENSFLVVGVSQNTDRKNLPLTIEAYRDFAKDKEDVFLLLVTNAEDPYGYDLWQFIKKFDLKKKVAITKESGPRRGMPDEKLNLVYNLASVHVNTSIGEGLSLPTLEAMAVGVPTLGTDYAAVPELIDQGGGYKLKVAGYLYGFNGIKRALVSKEDLVEKLNVLYNDFKTTKVIKEETSKKSIEFAQSLTWDKTAEIFADKIEKLSQPKTFSFVKERVKIKELRPLIVIPTWEKHCGIAEYTKSLFDAIRSLDRQVTVFPSYNYEEIPNLVKNNGYNLVHIQHEFSFFKDKNKLEKLLGELDELRVKKVLTLHTLMPGFSTYNQMLLSRLDDMIVHCDRFKESLGKQGETAQDLPICNIEVIEMGCGGILRVDENKITEAKRSLFISDRSPIIGSFGFLREQKGFRDILLAVKNLKEKYPKILLLLVCPTHEFGSKVYDETFFNFIEREGLSDNVLIVREYLEEEKLLSVLQCVDLFALNYKDSPLGGGLSAAVKTLFRAQRPVIVSDSIAFDDLVKGEVLKIKNSTVESLSRIIEETLMDKALTSNLVTNANEFVKRNNWQSVAKKHLELYMR